MNKKLAALALALAALMLVGSMAFADGDPAPQCLPRINCSLR